MLLRFFACDKSFILIVPVNDVVVFKAKDVDSEKYFKNPVQDKRECLVVVAELSVHLINCTVLNLECPFVHHCNKSYLPCFVFDGGLLFSVSVGGVILCVLRQLRGVGLQNLLHFNGLTIIIIKQ